MFTQLPDNSGHNLLISEAEAYRRLGMAAGMRPKDNKKIKRIQGNQSEKNGKKD